MEFLIGRLNKNLISWHGATVVPGLSAKNWTAFEACDTIVNSLIDDPANGGALNAALDMVDYANCTVPSDRVVIKNCIERICNHISGVNAREFRKDREWFDERVKNCKERAISWASR